MDRRVGPDIQVAVRRSEGKVDVTFFPRVGANAVTVPLQQGATMAWMTWKLPLAPTHLEADLRKP